MQSRNTLQPTQRRTMIKEVMYRIPKGPGRMLERARERSRTATSTMSETQGPRLADQFLHLVVDLSRCQRLSTHCRKTSRRPQKWRRHPCKSTRKTVVRDLCYADVANRFFGQCLATSSASALRGVPTPRHQNQFREAIGNSRLPSLRRLFCFFEPGPSRTRHGMFRAAQLSYILFFFSDWTNCGGAVGSGGGACPPRHFAGLALTNCALSNGLPIESPQGRSGHLRAQSSGTRSLS